LYSKANPSGLAFFYAMKKICIISDTHSLLAADLLPYLEEADEVWHAGDIGSLDVLSALQKVSVTKAVFGNIDGHDIRLETSRDLAFKCEGMKVFMTHIGGYPGRYNARVKAILEEERPDIYICGHSHICKIVKDHKLDLIHINPGACGISGFHKFRTIVRMSVEGNAIKSMQVVELGPRSGPDI